MKAFLDLARRLALAAALLVTAFPGVAEQTIGIDFGGEKKHESETSTSKKSGQDAENEKKDTSTDSKSREYSWENSETTKDGNVSTTHGDEVTLKTEKTTETEDGEATDKKSVEVGYEKSVEKKAETGDDWGEYASGEASAKAGIGGELSAGSDGVKAEGYVGGEAKAEAEAHVESDTYGNEYANVKGSAKGYIEAEVTAKLQAAFEANKDGIKAELEGKIGGSIGIRGEASVEVTLLGIPVTVIAEGKASIGAEAKASVGGGYDAKTGKLYFQMEAGVVFGAGASGKIRVEVGWDQVLKLASETGDKIIDKTLATFTDIDPEYVRDLMNTSSLQEKIEKIIRHEVEKNKKWDGPEGDILITNVLKMIDKGADFGSVYRYVVSLMKDDTQAATRILQEEIREQMGRKQQKDEEAKEEEKENEESSENDSETQSSGSASAGAGGSGTEKEDDTVADDDFFKSEPESQKTKSNTIVAPMRGSAKGNSSKRTVSSPSSSKGGGGNTSSRIW